MIRALIFDFDGLILETEGPDFQAWQEVFREHGAELPLEMWAQAVGSSFEESFDPYDYLEGQIGRRVDRETVRTRVSERARALLGAQTVLPGVVDTLDDAKARGLKLGVASSSPHSWVDSHLTRLGLFDRFDVICCSDDVARTKPDPALFQHALAGLGVKASEAIVFEDSPNGVTAANRAGIFCVAVPNDVTRSLPLDHADLRLDSLADMTLAALLDVVAQGRA